MVLPFKLQHFSDVNRRRYLWRCLTHYWDPARHACPNCGENRSIKVRQKMLVTALHRCQACQLLYRTPTDPPAFGEDFYQEDYDQGFTTDCPGSEQLETYLRDRFRGTPKDFSRHLNLLDWLQVKKGARVLDFGASWGYGTWQFVQAGFEATGYEPGRVRARYARERLGVPVVDDFHALNGNFDIIFSSHVMEHVPNPSQVIEQLKDLLRPGGVFIAFTPNGSAEYMRASAASYHRHWGMVHPNYLDELYYEQAFAPWPTLMSKTPVEETQIRAWNRCGSTRLKLDGWELLALALRPE